MSEKPTILGTPVSVLPVPYVESRAEPCSSCGAPTWVSVELRQAMPDSAVICTGCLPAGAEIDVHDVTRRELEELGFDPENALRTARQYLRGRKGH